MMGNEQKDSIAGRVFSHLSFKKLWNLALDTHPVFMTHKQTAL